MLLPEMAGAFFFLRGAIDAYPLFPVFPKNLLPHPLRLPEPHPLGWKFSGSVIPHNWQ